MLAHGILDRVLDMGNPRPAARAVCWLLVRCSDRAGLLAEVATTISSHGHNIQVDLELHSSHSHARMSSIACRSAPVASRCCQTQAPDAASCASQLP